jgi:hypothetical protein
VFGIGRDTLALARLSNVERLLAHLSGRVSAIREIVRRADKRPKASRERRSAGRSGSS